MERSFLGVGRRGVDYDLGVRSPCSSSRHEALFLPVYDQLVCDPEITDQNWEFEQDDRN